ncbi:ABC transporter substrate-binding protein [Carnimonas nigrificans]|uniref:ABC transporter substrate-binding protein n=1 Tax=Carnimonas nigrificans TaxID=64323 RepID=UPI00046F42F1|nr:ABC transporter substrate-binding protein [Carnimonas nigrificans]
MTSRLMKRCLALAPLFALPAMAHADTQPFTFLTNWYAQTEHGGFYQAKAEGLYEKSGLDVNLSMGGPQVNVAQLVAAGRAQCGITDDELGTMTAIQEGLPITLVATTFQKSLMVLIAHNDVKDFAQLKDKTILISSQTRLSAWPWLKSTQGYTDEQTRPYTFNLQPFINGKNMAQQGYLTSEPYALKQQGIDATVLPLSDAGFPPYGNVIACQNSVIEQHPEQVQAFIHASMQGWKDYLANPQPGNELIKKANPNMSQGLLDYAVNTFKSSGILTGGDAATQGIGTFTPERIEATWQMAHKLGLVKLSHDAMNKAYTTQFVKQSPVMP